MTRSATFTDEATRVDQRTIRVLWEFDQRMIRNSQVTDVSGRAEGYGHDI
jgi:hypothetical protein